MESRVNQLWRLAKRPVGLIKESDFKWHEEAVPALEENQVLVRIIYRSLDPAIRGWLMDGNSYIPPVIQVSEVPSP